MSADATRAGLDAALDRRFGDAGGLAEAAPADGVPGLAALARHRVIRG